MYLSWFNMLWFYKPGHTMTKPDALSRREDHAVEIEDDNKGIAVITPDKIRTTIHITDDGDILKQKNILLADYTCPKAIYYGWRSSRNITTP